MDRGKVMGFTKKQKEFIASLGFDPEDDYYNDEVRLRLYDYVSSLLQRKGFDEDYEITEIGIKCEELLDAMADDRCIECIQYRVDYSTDIYVYCRHCNKRTLRWIQYDYGTFGLICEKCGQRISADLNTPCEHDWEKIENMSDDEIDIYYGYRHKCRYPYRRT